MSRSLVRATVPADVTVPAEVRAALDACRTVVVPATRAELYQLALGPDGGPRFSVDYDVHGTTVTEALSQVQYFPSDLKKRMDALIREQVKAKKIRPTQGVAFAERYAKGLEEYTYYNFWGGEGRG